MKVLEGFLEFSALNGEEHIKVKAGERGIFQGVIEGGEIAYDILLKGKKIPKGQLLAVKPIDSKEMAKVAEAEKKRLKDIERKKQNEMARASKSKRPGAICEGPSGKLNECVWLCLNNPKNEKKSCLVGKGRLPASASAAMRTGSGPRRRSLMLKKLARYAEFNRL